MGCKQTTTAKEETPPVIVRSPTVGQTYVKSALRKSTTTGRGKTEKLSAVKRNPSLLNRSVNFDEKVRVKLRTPTPRESSYHADPTMLFQRQRRRRSIRSNSDSDLNDDNEVTSVSSEEESQQEYPPRSSSASSNSYLQRNQPNDYWHKTNSVGVLTTKPPVPPAATSQKPPLPPSTQIVTVTRSVYPPESNQVPTGKRLRVRRKVVEHDDQILSPSSVPLESSSIATSLASPQPSRSPTVSGNPKRIEQRRIIVEERVSPKPAYYAFKTRTRENVS